MKILVTGGAGFIGSHVVDAYLELGHEVVVVDNLSSGSIENLNPKAKFYKMDIRDSDIEDLFKNEKPDVVNHHAAQMDVRKSVEDPIYDADVNIIGSLNLLQNCIRYGVKKFIFASTRSAGFAHIC
jgi:UDP-glucose 4-epimerase